MDEKAMTSSDVLSQILSENGLTIDKIHYNQGKQNLYISVQCSTLMARSKEQQIIGNVKNALPFLTQIVIQPKYNIDITDKAACVFILSRMVNMSDDALSEKIAFESDDHLITAECQDINLYYRIANTEIDAIVSKRLKKQFSIDKQVKFLEPQLSEADKEAQAKRFDAYFEQIISENMPAEPSVNKVKKQKKVAGNVLYGKLIKEQATPLNTFLNEGDVITVYGELINFDLRMAQQKGRKSILSLIVSDHTNAIKAKAFIDPSKMDTIMEGIKKGNYYLVQGNISYDTYDKTNVLMIKHINQSSGPALRKDTADEKRIEFKLHTNMSAMDGLNSVTDYIARAKDWGHSAIGITDRAVVQSFPDAMRAAKDIKVHYGLEAVMVDDLRPFIDNSKPYQLSDTFVVFDIETTGFGPKYNGITEFGAVKVKDGAIVDRFSQLVNPEKPIPQEVVELTGISDHMVEDKPKIAEIMPKFIEFCGDAPLVAHNSDFDMSFIYTKCQDLAIVFRPMVIDSLKLARLLLTDIKRHNLKRLSRYFNVSLDNHHRAVDDALATAKIFMKMIEMLGDLGVTSSDELNSYGAEHLDIGNYNTYNAVLYAKNQAGLKAIYELVTHAHTITLRREPLLPKSVIASKRKNLLIGSADSYGEIYQSAIGVDSDAILQNKMDFYDYIEVQPAENNAYLLKDEYVSSLDELKRINERIVRVAEAKDKLCIATGNVHYLESEQEYFRRILMASQRMRGAEQQMPLYFRTTNEMLDAFSHFGEAKAKALVITNTHTLSDWLEDVVPVPKETFPPVIEGSDTELREICYGNAKRLYGEPIPEIVEKRLERELSSIIDNGYAVMYIIAQKLVAKSMEDGYLVGSRGSVGSSFAATMADITEVNPLPAHYRCAACKYSEFTNHATIKIGPDLPDKKCPVCGEQLVKDGFDIPFETFLGFEGDKEPDIDLNFAGVYQATSHAYTEELFGEGYTFKAGTIGTVADKTAYGFAMKYKEEHDLEISNYEVERLAAGCVGVKRTTGQHPGGIMVVPDYKDVHDFSPVQFPANDPSSGVKTLHFDYHSISGKILKLDILGHDVPTIIRTLEDFTGVKYQTIPLDDPATLSLFTSTDALKIEVQDYPIDSGTLGIPEFGTSFVRGMLKETMPTSIEELVQISGLSHGTDVWLGNANELIKNGTCTLKEVIGIRDNIMLYLIDKGLPKKDAFFTTEHVRKGKGLTEDEEAQMREYNVPTWYIESCKKISYMFPKAHAAAYVMSSLRIAYYKIYYPIAYYCTYFSTKVDDFDADLISKGLVRVQSHMQALKAQEKMTNKEENQYTIFESALEMYARGFKCHRVDLYKSDASKFIPMEDGILPPLRALQGVGENAAKSIVDARKNGEFFSVNDIKSRAKANTAVIEALRAHGVLAGLPEDNQLSLDFFMQG